MVAVGVGVGVGVAVGVGVGVAVAVGVAVGVVVVVVVVMTTNQRLDKLNKMWAKRIKEMKRPYIIGGKKFYPIKQKAITTYDYPDLKDQADEDDRVFILNQRSLKCD